MNETGNPFNFFFPFMNVSYGVQSKPQNYPRRRTSKVRGRGLHFNVEKWFEDMFSTIIFEDI